LFFPYAEAGIWGLVHAQLYLGHTLASTYKDQLVSTEKCAGIFLIGIALNL
jgi:hypothetical protein